MNEVHFIVGAATDVGPVRQVNEDAHGFLHSAAGDLLVVCDGMGGHAAGDLASKAARDTLIAHVVAAPHMDAAALLRQAIQAAHMEVRRLAQAEQGRQGMGTTCVVALVRGDHATVANVGDSRCFVVQGGRTRQLSKDHTKAQALFDQRLISAEQFATHPEKGVLNQALGQNAVPDPHIDALTLGLDDYLVLCSDGVYDCLSFEQLAELTFGANPNYAADNVVREAVQRDGKDNATTVIGRYVDLERKAVASAVGAASAVASAPKVAAPVAGASRPGWLMPVVFVVTGLVAGAALGGWAMKPESRAPVKADEPDDERNTEQINENGPGNGLEPQSDTPDTAAQIPKDSSVGPSEAAPAVAPPGAIPAHETPKQKKAREKAEAAETEEAAGATPTRRDASGTAVRPAATPSGDPPPSAEDSPTPRSPTPGAANPPPSVTTPDAPGADTKP